MRNLDNINSVLNIDFNTEALSQEEYKVICNTLKNQYTRLNAEMERVCKYSETLEYKVASFENKNKLSSKTLDKCRYAIRNALRSTLSLNERISGKINPNRFGINSIDEMQKDNI